MSDTPDRSLELMTLLSCVVIVSSICALAYFAYLGGQ